MDICYVGTRCRGYLGGVETYIRKMAPIFEQRGHNVVTYTMRGYDDVEGTNIEIPTMHDRRIEMLAYGLLSNIMSSFHDYDIVHHHSPISCAESLVTGRKDNIILTLHGMGGRASKEWDRMSLKAYELLESLSMKAANTITVVTKPLQRYLKQEYGVDSVYIQHGVEIKEHKSPDKIKTLGLEGDDYILYLGRLVPDKGAHHLIEACELLPT